jgi:hypothetical protein
MSRARCRDGAKPTPSKATAAQNYLPLIDIKRQKEAARRILIDVIGFRGVGIAVESSPICRGASVKASRSARPRTATPTSSR